MSIDKYKDVLHCTLFVVIRFYATHKFINLKCAQNLDLLKESGKQSYY